MSTAQGFNHNTPYPESLDGSPAVPDEINDAAVRQVCSNARSADEARQLLAMLGLHHQGQPFTVEPDEVERPETLEDYPSEGIGRRRVRPGSPCVAECGRTLRPSGAYAHEHPGTVKHAGRGLCATCRKQLLKAEA